MAGDSLLWFGIPNERFRDISALVGSRWLMGGKRDVRRWLETWQPNVLVIGPSWIRMLLGPGDAVVNLTQALHCPVTPLGFWRYGAGQEDIWILVRVEWNHDAIHN